MSREIFSLSPETNVVDALRSLSNLRLRRAPVLDRHGALSGFVSERDLLRVTPGTVEELDAESGRVASSLTVGQIATKDITCAQPDDHLEEVAKLFLSKKVGGVPVVAHGKVVGMISDTDIFRALIGAAHLSDTTRITVQRSRTTQTSSALEIVRSLDLSLVGYTEYTGPNDHVVLVIRVRGEQRARLGEALTHANWILLDRLDGKATRSTKTSVRVKNERVA
ncbi:MAG: CBS domain-containing protein [Planctomycetota bacterium]|jgi:CBS domain-containing protein